MLPVYHRKVTNSVSYTPTYRKGIRVIGIETASMLNAKVMNKFPVPFIQLRP